MLQQTAAQCSYHRYATVRSNPHIARVITMQCHQITTKKEKKDIFLDAQSAYKQMKA